MKKLAIIAVVTIGSLCTANAQSINIGAKAGVNFSNLTGDIENTKIRTSFHFGGVAEFKLSELFSLQPELLYSSQGVKQETDEGSESLSTVTSKIDYLNIPLTAKIYITDWFNIQAAPQVGFLISATQESDNPEIQTVEDFKEVLKEIDFSFKIGAEYKAPSGLFFDAHYNLGLANINDLVNDDANFKNGVIQLSVGFLF